MIPNEIWNLIRRSNRALQIAGRWPSIESWLDRHHHDRDEYEWFMPPSCGCCGRIEGYTDQVRLTEVDAGVHRCEKHIGRNPCCIDGCGKTFPIGFWKYEGIIMCGRHWRQAPKRFRELETLIRKRARRKGWTDKLTRQHDFIWHRCRRAIEAGQHVDMAEISKMFGWDP